MKSLYAFAFALFVSWGTMGQNNMQLLTPVTDAHGIYGTTGGFTFGYPYFPNSTTNSIYLPSSVNPPSVIPDAGTINYRTEVNISGPTITSYIYRLNNKWIFRADSFYSNVNTIGVAYYESVGTFETNTPPCYALYQFSHNGGVPISGSQFYLQLSSPCNSSPPSICNTELYPKLVNLASVGTTVMDTLSSNSGLRQGSIGFNNNEILPKYYDGLHWNEIYSPANNLKLEPWKNITFKDAYNINDDILLFKVGQVLSLNKNLNVDGEAKFGKTISVNAITGKISFYYAPYFTIAPAATIIIYKGASVGNANMPIQPIETGRMYIVKNYSQYQLNLSAPVKSTATVSINSIASGNTIRMVYDGVDWILID